MQSPSSKTNLTSHELFNESAAEALRFSFEFFPPANQDQEEQIFSSARDLRVLNPDFVSVTYGAGGTNQTGTRKTVIRLRDEWGFKAAAHLTCIGTNRVEIDVIARQYWDLGIRHLVALRGDPPAGTGSYKPTPGGYCYASDLISGLKRIENFEISVAAFPETHPEASSPQADLDNLKRKFDAGATRAITQFFFDPDVFLRFRDRVVAAGISQPLVPGILPIRSFEGVRKFAEKCGTSLPTWLHASYEHSSSLQSQIMRGGLIAFNCCQQLVREGVNDFHFYTLNKSEPTYSICLLLRQLFGESASTRRKETGYVV